VIRLLLFVTRFPPEYVGTAQYTVLLADGLARYADLDVTVLAPAYPGRTWSDAGLPYRVIRAPGLASRLVAARYPYAVQALRRTLNELRPDLLWAVNGMATRVAGIMAGRLPLPVIGTIHGTDIARRLPGRTPWTWLESLCQRRFYARADRLLTNSKFTHDLAVGKGLAPDRLQIIRLGVAAPSDPEGIRRRARERHPELVDRPIVLTVGRLVRQKGHRLLLSAMAELLPSRPQALHLVVGDGPEKEALQTQVRSLGLERQVLLTGRLPQETLEEYYALARVFALTSHEVSSYVEGMGFVFLEAAAWGLPAVATQHGGIPEAVADGESGFLVPAEVAPIVARLGLLLDDESLCRRISERAAERVRGELSLERMIREANQVVRASLAGR
jgi:glycosyltransferase involved in cell wall biosynthesis